MTKFHLALCIKCNDEQMVEKFRTLHKIFSNETEIECYICKEKDVRSLTSKFDFKWSITVLNKDRRV